MKDFALGECLRTKSLPDRLAGRVYAFVPNHYVWIDRGRFKQPALLQ